MKRLLILLLLLALPAVSAAAQVETPDECAARLAQDIHIETYQQATDWYDQVWRECAPEPDATDVQQLPLQTQSFGFSNTHLSATDCELIHVASDLMASIDISFHMPTGDSDLHWRFELSGIWHPFQPGEVEDANPPRRGFHRILFRTAGGADQFEIMETWANKSQTLQFMC